MQALLNPFKLFGRLWQLTPGRVDDNRGPFSRLVESGESISHARARIVSHRDPVCA